MSAAGTLGIEAVMEIETPMRDGVVLRGNLWRPRTDEPVPALLHRTPYGKPSGGQERLVRAGYAVLAQDTRGRYRSDGEFVPFTDPATLDGRDGFDTVEWLAAQPWCNGRVGTFGASYCAWQQWALARLRPPHLVAMCARSIPLEIRDVDWPAGSFRPGRRIKWWLTTIAPDLRRRAGWPPPHTPAEARGIWDDIEHGHWLGLVPWAEIVRVLPPPLDRYAEEWLREPGRRVWRFDQAHAEIEVPNLDVTGWFDHCWSAGHFQGMQEHGGSATARTQSKVIIGPWAHHTMGRSACGTVDFGPRAAVDLTDMEIRWFDHWLKGVDNGVDAEPPVRYFVMGSGEWREAASWPPADTAATRLYLGSGGHATRPDGDGLLLATPAEGCAADTYRYDPRDPVPTLWDRALFSGASDRRDLAYRRDIAIYRTAPLEAPVEVLGAAELMLYAATTGADTDFFARLVDEHPDGPALDVAHGMIRARHRESLEREEPIEPGAVTLYRIRLGDTACVFRQGHRIRLDITSSDFPSYDRNHNTGGNDLFDGTMVPVDQTVCHSAAYPSHLVLPLASKGAGDDG